MSRWRNRYWGQMYLVPYDWDQSADDADERVVDSFEYGRSHFKVAGELWALANEAERAAKIEDIFSAAYARKPPLMGKSDVEILVQLLEGLKEALIGTIIDEHLHIPSDRVPEVKRRTTMLELDEPNLPEAAIAAGLSRVELARDILQKALDENVNILLD